MSRVVITVRVSDETAEAIEKARGGVTRARWIENAINDALGRDQAWRDMVELGQEIQGPNEPAALASPKKATAPKFSGCDHPRARVIKGFCYKCGKMVLPK